MVNIIPAILTSNINELQNKLDQLTSIVEWAQIDLMDAKFVNNVSVKPNELKQIRTRLNLEAHLMVENPQHWLFSINPNFFRRVYFHLETKSNVSRLIKKIRQAGFETGLAINLETPITALDAYIDYIDRVLFMSVPPGWQNQKFHSKVLEKVKEFWQKYPHTEVAIDGGINETNIASAVEAGAKNICVGSAVFKSNDITQNIEKLKKALKL